MVEVQILTLLQSTFNYISRAWIYKTNRELPKDWKSNFKKISSDLAEIDTRINHLQQQVIESSVSSETNDPLTPLSYKKIVTDIFTETIQINDAVDAVQKLIDIGCETNEKLQIFFKRKDILTVREQITMMDSEAGRAFAEAVIGMPINSFYILFGLRLDCTKEIIKMFKQVDPKDENSNKNANTA